MAELRQNASAWIPTALHLPESGHFVNFVPEGEGDNEVLIGQFWAAGEGGGYFRDIIYGSHYWKVLRWKRMDVPPEEVMSLVGAHEELRKNLRRLTIDSLDTIETAQAADDVMDRMHNIRRKLGGGSAD